MFKSWLIFLFILNFSIFCATAKDSAQYFEEQLHLVEKKLLESSSVKKTQEIKSAEKDSELVSYTYEEPKKEGYKSAVSDSVKKVIEREEKKIAEVKRLPRKKIEIPLEEIPLDFMEQEEEENTESLPTFFSKLEHKSQTFNSKLRLKGMEFSLGESKKIIKEDLDFTALALRTEDLSVTQDISSVLINQNIKGQNLLAGKVKLSADYLPTYVNLFITEGESTEFIPFFTKQMVETKFPALRGGILLINLGVNPIKSVSDIKIDFKKKKKYQATYYDDKLEEVSEINLARYVLFTDVDLGNATVTYQFTDGREALKNIFIQEDALSYDVFAPVEIKSKFVNFYENIPLSQKTKDPLHLNENQLGLLSGKTLDTSKQIEKRALNRFEVPYYLGFKGERIYLSLNHEKVTYYLGFLEQEDLEVPSPEYLSLIYAKHEDIHSVNLKQQCVVLIKSSSAIDEIKSSARSIYGGFEAEISVIALDGLQYNKEALSKEMEVRSILISGHQEGMFDLTIRQGAYTKHLKTYCNPKGPLLVEHI